MRRGQPDTTRWPQGLAPFLAVSLVLHASIFAIRLTPPSLPPIPIEINPAIELGLEEARPGSPTPPPPTVPAIEEPPPPPPPPRTPRTSAPRPAPPPEPLPEFRDPPEPRVRTPDLNARRRPPSMTLETERDAGEDPDAMTVAVADASVPEDASTEPGVPGFASAAPDLAPAIPAGSVVTLLLRTDRLRENPQAPRIAALLDGIRDWRAVLGGTELDPLQDFNSILMASANPFGSRGRPPDLMALVRTRGPRGFLRASIEQMAGARPSSPVLAANSAADAGDAGPLTLRAQFEQPDGAVLPPAERAIWTRRGGAEVATVDRYIGPLSVVLLGEDLAAIASPERVPTLLSVLAARRGMTDRASDQGREGRLVALLQANGLRRLIAAPGAQGLVPSRADLGLYATRSDGRPNGGAELLSLWQYDEPAQAERMRDLFSAYMVELDQVLNQYGSSLQGRLAEGAGAVHFDRLHSIVHALGARADGNVLRIEATLGPDEVAELLNVQRLVQVFR